MSKPSRVRPRVSAFFSAPAFIFTLAFSAAPSALSAQAVAGVEAGAASPVRLSVSPLGDGIALGSLALAALGSEFLDGVLQSSGYYAGFSAASRESLGAFELSVMRPYSSGLDKAGDVAIAACLLLPALPAFLGTESIPLSSPVGTVGDLPDWADTCVIAGESVCAAIVAKNALKSFFPRARPYVYDASTPPDILADMDAFRSFPSGHSTIAFASASCAATLFILRNPGSAWNVPVAAGCFLAASGVATLRVASGNHFAGDVAAGAAIGTVIGIATPLLHLTRATSTTARQSPAASAPVAAHASGYAASLANRDGISVSVSSEAFAPLVFSISY